MKVAILLKTISQYQVLDHFASELHLSLKKQGIASKLCQENHEIQEIFDNPPDLTIQFNGVLSDNTQGTLFPDITRCPHLIICVDPIYRFWDALKHPKILLASDDRRDVDFLKNRGIDRTFFLPHAEGETISSFASINKLYPIVYLASWIDIDQKVLSWKATYKKQVVDWMQGIIEEILAGSPFTLLELALQYNLKNQSIPLLNLLIEIELYLKGFYRLELLRHTFPHTIHLFGQNVQTFPWESYFGDTSKRFHLHKAVTFKEALKIMGQSKIVLNSGLPYKDGAHERVFSALLLDALVITNQTPYLNEDFENGESILFFDPYHLGNFSDRISFYLENEEERISVVKRGKERTLANDTWDANAQRLVKELKQLTIPDC